MRCGAPPHRGEPTHVRTVQQGDRAPNHICSVLGRRTATCMCGAHSLTWPWPLLAPVCPPLVQPLATLKVDSPALKCCHINFILNIYCHLKVNFLSCPDSNMFNPAVISSLISNFDTVFHLAEITDLNILKHLLCSKQMQIKGIQLFTISDITLLPTFSTTAVTLHVLC